MPSTLTPLGMKAAGSTGKLPSLGTPNGTPLGSLELKPLSGLPLGHPPLGL